MKTVTINKKEYPIIFNAIVVMDFGKALGYKKMSDVQKVIAKFSKLTESNLEFETIDNLSKLLYFAILEGCDIKGVDCDISEKQIKRSFLEDAEGIIGAFSDGMGDAEVGEKKAVVEKKEK